MGKMFMPRKGSPGVTFLRPDAKLLAEIQKHAFGDEPEKAVALLQSLVLLDDLDSVDDFDSRKANIPTYLRKKLQVDKAGNGKVHLTNGAVIVPDEDFMARKDRDNINVYVISGHLVDPDGPDASLSDVKPKAKKGGADLGNNRRELFENVLRSYCNLGQDSAMELLVALYGWGKKNNRPVVVAAVEAKASLDTLATLAIVLQPYKTGPPDYILDGDLKDFVSVMYKLPVADVSEDKNTFQTAPVYSLNEECQRIYETRLARSETFSNIAAQVKSESRGVADTMSKATAVSILTNFYNINALEMAKQVADRNGCPVVSKQVLFAESELRVLSAVMLENSNGHPRLDEARAVYENCTLDKPYLCADSKVISQGNLGFYYSTVYLMARSDALFHVPGQTGDGMDKIADDNCFIGLNQYVGKLTESHRRHSQDKIEQFKTGQGF